MGSVSFRHSDTLPPFVWPNEVEKSALPLVLTVLRERAGLRLDQFITAEMPRLSRNRAAKIASQYTYNAKGIQLKPSTRMHTGDVIVLYRPPWEEPDAPKDVNIVHQDDAIIVADKPAGLPVHPTARYNKNTLISILSDRFPGEALSLAHRIDKETSGLLVVARNYNADVALKKAFAERDVHKVYLALVYGAITGEQFVIDAPMVLVGGDVNVLMAVKPESEGGQPSITHIRVIQRLAGYTLVEAEPKTGRQHQIRVHLAHIGRPIVGDKLYAFDPSYFKASLNDQLTDEMKQQLILARHALHAHRITFAHPTTSQPVTYECALPEDMQSFVDQRA